MFFHEINDINHPAIWVSRLAPWPLQLGDLGLSGRDERVQAALARLLSWPPIFGGNLEMCFGGEFMAKLGLVKGKSGDNYRNLGITLE
jgi:hypothetical protein